MVGSNIKFALRIKSHGFFSPKNKKDPETKTKLFWNSKKSKKKLEIGCTNTHSDSKIPYKLISLHRKKIESRSFV